MSAGNIISAPALYKKIMFDKHYVFKQLFFVLAIGGTSNKNGFPNLNTYECVPPQKRNNRQHVIIGRVHLFGGK